MAESTLDKALREIRQTKAFSKYQVGYMSDYEQHHDVVPTDVMALDIITGIGGLPLGIVAEFFGLPSSGKTTAAVQVMAAAQRHRPDKKTLFCDVEGTGDKKYFAALGLDLDNCLYFAPDTLEDAANITRKLIRSGELSIVTFDSIGATIPEAELEADTGAAQHAQRAKTIAQFMKQVNIECKRTDTTLILLNHVFEIIEQGFAARKRQSMGIKKEDTPGGRSVKFMASIRIQFKAISNERMKMTDPITQEEVDVPSSTITRALCIKNKLAPPFREAELRSIYGTGFSNAFTALTILTSRPGSGIREEKGIVRLDAESLRQPSNPSQSWIRGFDTAAIAIEADPTWLSTIVDTARKLLNPDDFAADEATIAEAKGEVEEQDSEPEELLTADLASAESLDALLDSPPTQPSNIVSA